MLKLHYRQNTVIGDWDMDEFLVSTPTYDLEKTTKKNFYLPLNNYDIVDVEKELPVSIKDCLTRKIQPSTASKSLIHTKMVKYIISAHGISIRNLLLFEAFKTFPIRMMKLIMYRIFKRLSSPYLPTPLPDIYLIHAHPIKEIWKDDNSREDRIFRAVFDSKIHIKDENIQKNLEKANL